MSDSDRMRLLEQVGCLGIYWDPSVRQYLVKPREYDTASVEPCFYFTHDLEDARAVAGDWFQDIIENAERAAGWDAKP